MGTIIDMQFKYLQRNIVTLINLCILASAQTIPQGRPADKAIPGWNEQVRSYKERSLFWHWIWLEAGKPVMFIVVYLVQVKHLTGYIG